MNCSAQTDTKTEKIRITVKAAEKQYLEIKNIGWEEVNGNVQRRSAQLKVTSAKKTIPKSTMSRGERNVPWWEKTAGKQLK